jgi:hypothetical protein
MKAKDLLEKSGTMSLALVERNGQGILEWDFFSEKYKNNN